MNLNWTMSFYWYLLVLHFFKCLFGNSYQGTDADKVMFVTLA